MIDSEIRMPVWSFGVFKSEPTAFESLSFHGVVGNESRSSVAMKIWR